MHYNKSDWFIKPETKSDFSHYMNRMRDESARMSDAARRANKACDDSSRDLYREKCREMGNLMDEYDDRYGYVCHP